MPRSSVITAIANGGAAGSIPVDTINSLSPIAWFRASDISQSDGTAVTTWTSREGSNLEATQGTGSAQPTYKTGIVNGQDVVRFADEDFLDATTDMASLLNNKAGATLFVVAQTDRSTDFRSPFWISINGDTGLARFGLYKTDEDAVQAFSRDVDASGSTAIVSIPSWGEAWQALCVTADIANQGLGFSVSPGPSKADDDTEKANSAFPNTSAAEVVFGVGNNNYWQGDIAEIVLFDKVLTPSERNSVLSELNGLYGLYAESPTVSGWQTESNAMPVPLAGQPYADWATDSGVAGGSGTQRTFLEPAYGVLANSTLRRAKIVMQSSNGDTNKLKAFRYNGATWDLVDEQSFTGANGTQDIDLSPAWTVNIGDVPAYMLNDSGETIEGSTSSTGLLNTIWDTSDATGTGNSFANSLGFNANCEFYGDRAYLALLGDSIIGGHVEWQTHVDTQTPGAGVETIPGGDSDDDPGQEINALNSDVTWINYGRGSQTWAFASQDGGAFDQACEKSPHTIVMAYGVNDVNTARTWLQVEADLDAIKAKWDLTNVPRLAICEILPWTNGDDTQAATIRTWNSYLATWCTNNGVTLIECHDAMGQIRGTTGELDDLNSTYDEDGIHLTQAGIAEYASLIATGLGL